MVAKRDEAVATVEGVIGEAAIHGGVGRDTAYLVIGVDFPTQERTVLVVPADQAAVLYPGREITLEVRLR